MALKNAFARRKFELHEPSGSLTQVTGLAVGFGDGVGFGFGVGVAFGVPVAFGFGVGLGFGVFGGVQK